MAGPLRISTFAILLALVAFVASCSSPAPSPGGGNSVGSDLGLADITLVKDGQSSEVVGDSGGVVPDQLAPADGSDASGADSVDNDVNPPDQNVQEDQQPVDGSSIADTGLGDSGADGATEDDTFEITEEVAADIDAGPPTTCPGAPDCPCSKDQDCYYGLCADHKDGSQTCAGPCDASGSCDLGQVCNTVGAYDLCVQADLRLCDPCAADTVCQVPGGVGAACVAVAGQGNFCGIDCLTNKDCPLGYTCQNGKSVSGDAVKQCMPAGAGVCNCTVLAQKKGLSTTCSNSNDFGNCTGSRKCLAKGTPGAPPGGGLGLCSAPVAAAEVCNGLDDDCNGITDGYGSCDDGNPCTDDVCDGKSCQHWVNASACNDGNACTQEDTCSDAVCAGTLVSCDDKNPCTADACQILTGCTHNADDTAKCGDGNACQVSACNGGNCKQSPKVCDDGNPCTDDACDPAKGCTATANDANPCSDENACTTDNCKAGKCYSKINPLCDDGNACTIDSCDTQAGCVAGPLPAGYCDDKNPCTTDSCDPMQGCVHVAVAGCSGQLPFSTQFNCGDLSNNDWKLDAAVGGVGWGFDASPSPPGANSPACSLNYNNGTSYDNGQANGGNAVSPQIDASLSKPNAPIQISFYAAGSYEASYYDQAFVQYSTDDVNWTTIAINPNSNGNNDISPFGNTWTKVTGDLSAVAGKKFKIRFNFQTLDSIANATSGPFIDDLVISDPSCSKNADCNDKNACTDDFCDLTTGKCSATANNAACNDNNPCTSGDACSAGGCVGVGKVCDDKNPCTTDSCDTKTGVCAYVNVADGLACTDNNPCTTGDVCITGSCTAIAKCDDKNPCTKDVCDALTGLCTNGPVADGTPCSDVDPCTSGDVCTAAKCAGIPAGNCSSSLDNLGCDGAKNWTLSPAADVPATAWHFDALPTPPAFHSAPCSLNYNNDANFACAAGVSKEVGLATSPVWTAAGAKDVVVEFYSFADVGTNLYLNKRWLEVSTDDFLSTAVAIALPNDVTVNAAWIPYKFDLSAWVAGKNFRLRWRLDSITCAATSTKGWFVDDLKITTDLPKACLGDGDCNDGNPCSTDSCKNGSCNFVWNTGACDDGNACTVGDTCGGAGICAAGGAKPNCDDLNSCTTDSCDPIKGCLHVAVVDGLGCSDGDPCTAGDNCQAGLCKPTGNSADGTGCDDGNTCTAPDQCKAGKCAGVNACDDGNPCTLDVCSIQAGIKSCTNNAIGEGGPCDDGNACTAGDSCLAGKCTGYLSCSDLLNDSFDCNAPSSWTLDLPALGVGWKVDGKPSPLTNGSNAWQSPSCSLNYNNDTNFDNGQANAGNALSPVLAIPAAGPITISFWTYVDMEGGTPYDSRYLDYLDAGSGVVLGTVTLDYSQTASMQWIALKYTLPDATLGKNIKLRFRFNSVDSVGNQGQGWFIDDVVVKGQGAAACKIDSDCKDDGNPCTDAKCLNNQCAQMPGAAIACDDGNPCTVNTACSGGLCKAGTPLVCDDGYACTADSCDPKLGCVFTPQAWGSCGVSALPYAQTFTCNDKVSEQFWKFDSSGADGPAWAVDASPALPGFFSPDCAANFNNGTDTSCGAQQLSLDSSLISPIFDATPFKAGTAIQLTFYLAGSWDIAPAAELDVEASVDGKTWNILKSYGAQDSWTKFVVALTPYAGKKFQLRFHFLTPSCVGTLPGTGPFIDDFAVIVP